MRNLPIKKIQDPYTQKGSIYLVTQINQLEGGNFILTTDQGKFLLPAELSMWAFSAIDGAQVDERFFPCKIEFCRLPSGRISADYLDHDGALLPTGERN
jgi:hypothetical protein